jgi:hypothetical protein
MDGAARMEIFVEGTEMSKREPRFDDISWIKAETVGEDQTGDDVYSRLADLGYLN